MIAFDVIGAPAPQGSKRHVGGGRMIESSKKVRPWRQDVKAAAIEALYARGSLHPLQGPLRLVVVFTVVKPLSAPKRRRTWPCKKPDVDKLLRSTMDALTDAGLWRDDGQVIDVRAVKAFPGEHPEAMPVPGARIQVEAAE